MATIEKNFGKDYLEATYAYNAEVAKMVEAGRTWDVSPMTWKADTGYVATLTTPEPEVEEDEEDEELSPEDKEWARYCSAWKHQINPADITARVSEMAAADDNNPLIAAIASLQKTPPYDIERITELRAFEEQIGHYMSQLAISLIQEQLGRALSPVAF